MDVEIFPFTLGDFKCKVVSDGTLAYGPPIFPTPAVFLCANAPQEQLVKALNEQGLDPQNWPAWSSSYNCLLVETPGHKVLIDTGADGLGPNTGKLLSNLQKEGISPEDIDLVILTHGHPDHIGGNTNNEGKPIFSKARWVMWKEEWQFWTSNQAASRLDEHSRDMLIGIARKNLLPLKDRLDLIDNETEIVPGITAMAAPGHTPGQMALKISSQGKHLICISDVVLHPLHLAEPGWCAAVDILPDQVVQTRESLLPEVASEVTLVMAFHFPFPGLGYIVPKGKAWTWSPL